ncbi:hypothetical protein IW140_000302 [Coemansia sp. RSA 1813]|nr:hypothetical protein EV178_000503 [Coemansia sp. RSA 1646]KAJ1773729.1 hypothetical protein LPJ74_000272 [Coemansia sp. RSA 1843]KAJ2093690.1 hypothetical protein IW138_000085 [Coemansia sp. RSA 986]KAJ2217904.1 hypothetical protein EV179_000048 [Coemansia sp. RSA 487]KAJ2573258.1 hypothetical protein IW140_000302 [Coemansia sp. RSA 1813]
MSIPLPSNFVLEQGKFAQERRRRSKSVTAFSSATTSSTDSTAGRRRNTVGTTAFQRPPTSLTSISEYPLSPTAATDGYLSPRMGGSYIPCAAVSSGVAGACGHRHGIMSRTTSPLLPVDVAATDALYIGAHNLIGDDENDDCDEQVMLLTPLSPPMTPEQPVHTHAPAPSSSIMSLPNLSLSALGLPSASSVCSDTGSTPLLASLAEPELTNNSVTCLVLDNKQIHLARPRLVQISPSSKY